MTTILSIDPGKRTGVAVVTFDDETAPVLEQKWEVYGGLEGFKNFWGLLKPEYDILLCEKFTPREGVKGIDYTPMGTIGWLSQFDPIMQPPAGRKKAVPDSALKRLGLYLPGEPNRNAREAVRHAVWYLKNHGHKPTIRKGFVNIDW